MIWKTSKAFIITLFGNLIPMGLDSVTGQFREWLFGDFLSGVTKTFTNPSRSLNSSFQISTMQDAFVSYGIDTTCTLSLSGGQSAIVTLKYADDSGITTNAQTVNAAINTNSGSLTLGLNIVQTVTLTISGVIPAGKWAIIASTNNVGTPTFTFRSAQEVLQ